MNGSFTMTMLRQIEQFLTSQGMAHVSESHLDLVPHDFLLLSRIKRWQFNGVKDVIASSNNRESSKNVHQ